MSEPLSHALRASSRRALDPIERSSEILFGLIMVLTFTGSIDAAESGRAEIRTLLIAAVGCNLAWGIVDAVMYLLSSLAERGRSILTLRAVRSGSDPATACRAIAAALPPVIASLLTEPELEAIRQRVNELPHADVPERATLTLDDLRGALAVLLLVFLSTFPVAIPFLFMTRTSLALRASNGIAIAMLFLIGFQLGRYIGHRPLRVGVVMAVVGVALVFMTIALGG